MNRSIKKLVTGQKSIDGAGVHLVRVLAKQDVEDFDPFLMLDSFDSKNPDDYIKGFPTHPHRGIETITYLIEGQIKHEDSLGNKGIINTGESQWMTAGSGILHQEIPQSSERMLGLQIWLNLSKENKMTNPSYFDIKNDMIGIAKIPEGIVRVISGEYENLVKGTTPPYLKATFYDISLNTNQELTINTKEEENVFVFLIEGEGIINNKNIAEKTAVLFNMDGQTIAVKSSTNSLRFFFFSGKQLKESVAWGGPIVMNTKEELLKAFDDLQQDTFIK